MIPITPAPSSDGFRPLRWLSVFLRGLHLVTVIQFSAFILIRPAVPPDERWGIAVLLSGLALWALDLWQHPAHLRQRVGLCMLVKLLLVAAMLHLPALRWPLLWVIVIGSAVFSHAPASFRNASWCRRRRVAVPKRDS
jgi:4-amino-4-deoxy-L-arabinose transferase-like glycosyltransferase